eukprot:CAMPEP_0204371922 /NCGR_PEP_ID=MMETSP0469-20131031/46871_1 /ASSEMBLY_ACC=CAM_ASM_000384 /TAXON_ID=2969 /ORGANISM="Oxyrrhis marina" /LENGTH=123 /DNA_ID=CAMNT_0051362111 /DNA_START=11 /DNA_END=379 /DNA_ORIENTATION=+
MAMLCSAVRLGGLWRQSMVRCADNTGIVKACIIGLGKNQWGTGATGQRIRVSVRDQTPAYNGPKMPKGIIYRTKMPVRRKDGSHIKFDENAFVVVAKNKAKGTKIKGPVAQEIQHSSKHLAKW